MSTDYPRTKITDEFSGLLTRDGRPASRQQIRMARCRRDGLCITCGDPAVVKPNGKTSPYCLDHSIKARERMRSKRGSRKRLKPADGLEYKHEVNE